MESIRQNMPLYAGGDGSSVKQGIWRRGVREVAEVAKGVFQGVRHHLINLAPWYLSKITNLRIFAVIGHFAGAYDQLDRPHSSWVDSACSGLFVATHCIGMAEIYGLFPLETEYRIAADTLSFVTALIGSGWALFAGTRLLYASWHRREGRRSSRISDCVSGGILLACGTIGLRDCIYGSLKSIRGWKEVEKLDLKQKRYVLHSRASSFLGEPKRCNAVIFDGLFPPNRWSDYPPSPLSEEIYQHCNTFLSSAESSTQFCAALKDASKRFGGAPIDLLSLQGHANSAIQMLSDRRYFFRANTEEIECINRYLAPDGHLLTIGCDTGTPLPNGNLTLTEKLADGVRGRWVMGIAALYNPFFAITDLSEGQVQHDSYVHLLHTMSIAPSAMVKRKGPIWGQCPLSPTRT